VQNLLNLLQTHPHRDVREERMMTTYQLRLERTSLFVFLGELFGDFSYFFVPLLNPGLVAV